MVQMYLLRLREHCPVCSRNPLFLQTSQRSARASDPYYLAPSSSFHFCPYAHLSNPAPTPSSSYEVRVATRSDAPFIEAIRRRNGNELGFIPYSAIRSKAAAGHALILSRDRHNVGFLIASYTPPFLRIQYLAIAKELRRNALATSTLITAAARLAVPRPIALTLRCALDIEATLFWSALGFLPVALEKNHAHPCRTLVRWILWKHYTQDPKDARKPEAPYLAFKSLVTSAPTLFGSPNAKRLPQPLEQSLLELPLNFSKAAALYSVLP